MTPFIDKRNELTIGKSVQHLRQSAESADGERKWRGVSAIMRAHTPIPPG
ncbi:MAG: hypothetical protein Kow0060_03930 [Methylohalobius crimeensis]